MIKIALADDHKLLRNALAKLINTFEGCEVVFEADNGKEFCEHIKKEIPNLAIIDYNMPEMNGLECANWMKKHYPTVPILMLTMYDTELMLIKLLQAGVKGFMKKDIHPNELQKAIQSVITDGFYYSVHTSAKLAGFFTERESIPLWDKIYEVLMGGFEDLSKCAKEDEDEEDELDNIPDSKKTKTGYLKDGFIVDGDTESDVELDESDDTEETEDEEEEEDIPKRKTIKKKRKIENDDNEDTNVDITSELQEEPFSDEEN